VVDIFAAVGLKKPDIFILSDVFRVSAEVRNRLHRNLAVALLRNLLNNEIRVRSMKFLIQSIQSKSVAETLAASIRKSRRSEMLSSAGHRTSDCAAGCSEFKAGTERRFRNGRE
jgi:hypothetical protein